MRNPPNPLAPFELARIARCLLLARDNDGDPANIARQLYAKSNPRTVEVMKSAVDGHGTTGTGAELNQPSLVAAEFADAVRPATVLGKLKSTIRIPFSTPLSYISSRTQFNFVAEREPAPSVAPGFSDFNLPLRKIAGLITISKELARSSEAEAVLANEMASGVIEAIDKNFLDATAGSASRPAAANYDPLEIYQGSGVSTAAQVDQLTQAMLGTLVAAGSTLATAVFVTTPTNCAVLSTMRDPNGGLAFPTISATGGTLAGLPLIASAAATSLTLIDGAEVVVADDSQASISVSEQAFISQSDDPENENVWISLFQSDSLGLKVVRHVNWRMRNNFVVYAANFSLTPFAQSTV